ncbi:hypothetical protein BOX15_Mlig010329g1 [Macrostomum lignano]|uniref:Uncharacterized protein n=1 Tax=Macrostomum lignano TaxID=282301 RepID=A0A267GNE6_9PLAT|nr:hypothetical protein BOX15_Mlig010329g1 [Macrostomum lignano]
MFDEEEEEDEEGGGRDNFVENPEFEPMPVRELIDPSLSSWVHHVQHVLPQGRTRWWNPAQKRDDDSVDDEDEEEKEEMDEPQPEEGPPLLTPLSEDAEVDGNQPWTARLSSQLLPQFSVAVLSSNLWPGAYARGPRQSIRERVHRLGPQVRHRELQPTAAAASAAGVPQRAGDHRDGGPDARGGGGAEGGPGRGRGGRRGGRGRGGGGRGGGRLSRRRPTG